MEKEFVSYSIALKLKKIGFNEECLAYYDKKKLIINDELCLPWILNNEHIDDYYAKYKEKVAAPLYQQTLYWFREKHNYSGEVYYYESSDFGKWHFDIEPLKLDGERYTTPVKEGFNTHQEAQEKLIEKLIEIVENG